MSNEYVTFTYEVEDGYVGGSRPQEVRIYAHDLESCTSEEEVRDLIEEVMVGDFQLRVYPEISDDSRVFELWEEVKEKEDQ